MTKKRLIILLLSVVLVAAAVLGLASVQGRGATYGRARALELTNLQVEELYASLSPATRETYPTIDDFAANFIDTLDVLPAKEGELVRTEGNWLATRKTYVYQATREDDLAKGYLISVAVSGLPFSPATDEISVQSVDIMPVAE